MTVQFLVLLDASVRISLVAIAVCGIVYLLRVQSSSLRHKAWQGVLFAMMLMPVLPRIVPRLEIPVVAPAQSATRFAIPRPKPADGASSAAYMAQTQPTETATFSTRPCTRSMLWALSSCWDAS
jgi:hypothetical protein